MSLMLRINVFKLYVRLCFGMMHIVLLSNKLCVTVTFCIEVNQGQRHAKDFFPPFYVASIFT